MKIKRGFSLTELLVSIAIIVILSSMITLNINSHKQTAKKEAEKLEAFIHDLMRKADRSHRGFALDFEGGMIRWFWKTDETSLISQSDYKIIYNPSDEDDKDNLVISKGFTITHNFGKELTYKTTNNFDKNGHFTIINDENKTDKYYLDVRFGRVRISSTPPNP